MRCEHLEGAATGHRVGGGDGTWWCGCSARLPAGWRGSPPGPSVMAMRTSLWVIVGPGATSHAARPYSCRKASLTIKVVGRFNITPDHLASPDLSAIIAAHNHGCRCGRLY
jgi:hypothetical protein